MPSDRLRAWLPKILWEMAMAVALAAALAFSSGGTVVLALRYLAGFSGLGSLGKALLAIVRERPLSRRLSEWDEALVLAALSAGAHLVATHMDKVT